MQLENEKTRKAGKLLSPKDYGLLFSLVTILILPLAFYVYSWWKTNLPLISPLDLIETLPLISNYQSLNASSQEKKLVLGFLPYWNIKDSKQIPIKYLSHLAYFGLDLNDDGSIKKYENPKELEPGYNKLNSTEFDLLHRQLKLLNKKTILVIRAMSNDQIKGIVNSKQHRQTATEQVMEILKQKQFDGLNLDFEPTGFLDSATQQNFTLFAQQISQTCKSYNPDCEISLDIYAKSAVERRLHQLQPLIASIDYFIIMAYDFHSRSSTQAGPVAPLIGACDDPSFNSSCLEYDIQSSIADISQIIPPEKLILGLPFYGYQWQTVDDTFLSNTYNDSGSLATYKRIQDILKQAYTNPGEIDLTASWSATTLSPYLVLQEDEQISQIHYEDPVSLTFKLDFVNQTGLAGIGIWALGYEVPHLDLWQAIADNL